jgi:hypothetical protein
MYMHRFHSNNLFLFNLSENHNSLAALTSLLLKFTLPEQMALSSCFLLIPNFLVSQNLPRDSLREQVLPSSLQNRRFSSCGRLTLL